MLHISTAINTQQGESTMNSIRKQIKSVYLYSVFPKKYTF